MESIGPLVTASIAAKMLDDARKGYFPGPPGGPYPQGRYAVPRGR